MLSSGRLRVGLTSLALAGCGGASPNEPGPPLPPPPASAPSQPVETFSVDVVAFYDENRNGALDTRELVRIPGAEVEIGGAVGRTVAPGGTGRLDGVSGGSQLIAVHTASLPPFYEAGAPRSVTVPAPDVVPLPITLPIGDNVPNRYLAFGDSITEGGPGHGGGAYRSALERLLGDHFGAAEVVNAGLGGTTSNQGNDRFPAQLARHRPAVALIVYGTNDWNACTTPDACFTTRALREMVRTARSRSTMPFVATLPPVNTGYDRRAPPDRNAWIVEMNGRIREMVEEEGAVLMDVHAAFVAAADGDDYSRLIADHVHPTPFGYDVMAHAMAQAITRRLPLATQTPGL